MNTNILFILISIVIIYIFSISKKNDDTNNSSNQIFKPTKFKIVIILLILFGIYQYTYSPETHLKSYSETHFDTSVSSELLTKPFPSSSSYN